jgi:hypothetical protein
MQRTLTLLICLALGGCVLFERSQPEASADTTVLRAREWGKVYRGGRVRIVSVDARAPSWRITDDMVLDPGPRTGEFQVLLCATEGLDCQLIASTRVSFRVEAGRTYIVRAQERVNGSNRFFVWVEDAQSRALAGGEAPAGG